MKMILGLGIALLASSAFAEERFLNAKCSTLLVAWDTPGLMTAETNIFYSGLLAGAAGNDLAEAVLKLEYRKLCEEARDVPVRVVIQGAIDAARARKN